MNLRDANLNPEKEITVADKNKNQSPMKAVYVIRENGEKSSWMKIGVAFVNRDDSLNVILDAVPVNGKLHIRDFKDASA